MLIDNTWTSPASSATYPMGWRVRIPGQDLDVILSPVLEESEFDARGTTLNSYWEGEVTVSGSHSGSGFVELVGYAPIQETAPANGPSSLTPRDQGTTIP